MGWCCTKRISQIKKLNRKEERRDESKVEKIGTEGEERKEWVKRKKWDGGQEEVEKRKSHRTKNGVGSGNGEGNGEEMGGRGGKRRGNQGKEKGE